MRAYLATNVIGSFVFDGKGKMVAYTLFPKDPEKIVKEITKLEAGEVLNQEKELVNNVKKIGYKELICNRAIKANGIICVEEKNNLGEETNIRIKFD